ncbi:hypothetical protein [Streptomyces sp. NPDC059970]|uniref:hypothetical protein n=1 Tax=Streptomyces sp. NPDC059970 TaxID=3347019 RepID=UPI0036A808C4
MMRRITLTAGAVAAAIVTVGGCAGTDVTKARLEGALGPEFSNLYVLQQRARHGNDRAERPDRWADCNRGTKSSPDRGAADDWTCVVRWPSPGGVTRPLTYEVHVLPTGCFTAQGPATQVGQQLMKDIDGVSRTNPLYEFDGCFDIS